jgi:hypothetical protein
MGQTRRRGEKWRSVGVILMTLLVKDMIFLMRYARDPEML